MWEFLMTATSLSKNIPPHLVYYKPTYCQSWSGALEFFCCCSTMKSLCSKTHSVQKQLTREKDGGRAETLLQCISVGLHTACGVQHIVKLIFCRPLVASWRTAGISIKFRCLSTDKLHNNISIHNDRVIHWLGIIEKNLKINTKVLKKYFPQIVKSHIKLNPKILLLTNITELIQLFYTIFTTQIFTHYMHSSQWPPWCHTSPAKSTTLWS